MNDLDRNSLQAQLRAGDPYQGEDMPAAHARRIRTRLRAAGSGRFERRTWLAAAAAAALAAVIGLGTWAASGPAVPREQAPTTAGEPAEPEARSGPLTTAELPRARETARVAPPSVRRAPRLPVATEVSLAVPPVVADADREPPRSEARRIQFTARRGTRIVWTLDPDFEPNTIRTEAPTAPRQQGANDPW